LRSYESAIACCLVFSRKILSPATFDFCNTIPPGADIKRSLIRRCPDLGCVDRRVGNRRDDGRNPLGVDWAIDVRHADSEAAQGGALTDCHGEREAALRTRGRLHFLRRACTAPLVRFSAAAIERAERPASCRSRSLRSSSSVQALPLFDVIHCQSRNVSAKTQSRRDRSSDYLVCGEQFDGSLRPVLPSPLGPLIATLGTGTASALVRLKLPASARSASRCGHETGGVSVAGFVTRSVTAGVTGQRRLQCLSPQQRQRELPSRLRTFGRFAYASAWGSRLLRTCMLPWREKTIFWPRIARRLLAHSINASGRASRWGPRSIPNS
jgi:hypothetical protein